MLPFGLLTSSVDHVTDVARKPLVVSPKELLIFQ